MNKRILTSAKSIVTARVQKPKKFQDSRPKIGQPVYKGVLAKLLAVAVVPVLVSCQVSAHRRGVLHHGIHPEADITVNTEQARLRMRVLVEPFCGGVQAAADQIIASTTNHAVRREALLWKIEAVPILREALFHPNPYLALGDTWAFLRQMGQYFQNGPGKQALGDSAPVAAGACASLEEQLTAVASSFTRSRNVTDVRAFIEKWAADHPIEHLIAGRESVVGYFTKRGLEETFSAPEAAGDFIVTADDLSRRIDIYGGQLLDQTRWQAELFAMDVTKEYQVENVIPLAGKAIQSATAAADAVDRAIGPLERTATALETAPEIVSKERAAAQQAIHEEVSRTIQFGRQELTATFEQLTKERAAALLELHRNIAEERSAFSRDMERLSFNVVDHAFLRSAQLAGVIALVAFAGAVFLLFLTRRLFLAGKTTA